MAKAPRLKVYTAPIGFHDVYVAAPSRAAALRAWGSDHDLFARGLASAVTDPALATEPLARPGEVIRRMRGTEAEQFAALPADGPARKARADGASKVGRPAPKAVPKPSRKELDAAEAALEAAAARHRGQDAEALARVEAAQRDQRDLQRRNREEARSLAEERDAARERYDATLGRRRRDR